MPLLDDIWGQVPGERPLERASLGLVLETLGLVRARFGDGPPRVLDLGCGDGRLAARLAESGASVTGLDPSGVALERARDRHPELDLAAPRPDGGLPFGDAVFDCVVCVQVLQHVADTQRLLSEIRRVTAPGGWLAAAVPWHGRLRSALGSFERQHDPLEPVLRFYTPRSLGGLFEAFGFEQIELRGAGGIPLLRETLLARARRGSLY